MTDELTEVRNALDRLGVEYEFVPCEPELADTALFCEHYGYSPQNSANALLIKGTPNTTIVEGLASVEPEQ
jgi:hypothetical protein